MKKQLLFIFLSSISLTILGSCTHTYSSHNHSEKPASNINSKSNSAHHHHHTLEIPPGQPVPEVDLVVYPDAKKGWNLEIKTENFQFSPQEVNQAHQPNQGHAHLYVNGEKIARLYGNWYYLEELAPGTNEIKVTLNSNSHEDFAFQGEKIEDLEVIEVAPKK